MFYTTGTTGLFIMSNENKVTVRTFFWLFLVVGVMFSPFYFQHRQMEVCKEVFNTTKTTKEAGNCYWQIQYGSNIYE